MLLDECINLFLLSRKRGTGGARGVARPQTIYTYRYDLEKFVAFLQERGILEYGALKKTDVIAYVDAIAEKGWAEASRLKVLRSLRAFFRWVEQDEDCQAEGLKSWAKALPFISNSPFKKFVPERTQLRKFMLSVPVHTRLGMRDYVLMSLLIDTGIRIGEACTLCVDNVKLDERRIIVSGKTGTRLVTLSSDMARLLKPWLKKLPGWAKCGNVFPSRGGHPSRPNTFDQSFRRYRQRSGVSGITPHTFRHCFCTYFIEAGGDIAKLQALTGHSSLDILRRYLNLSGRYVEQEQERVSPLRQVKTSRSVA